MHTVTVILDNMHSMAFYCFALSMPEFLRHNKNRRRYTLFQFLEHTLYKNNIHYLLALSNRSDMENEI